MGQLVFDLLPLLPIGFLAHLPCPEVAPQLVGLLHGVQDTPPKRTRPSALCCRYASSPTWLGRWSRHNWLACFRVFSPPPPTAPARPLLVATTSLTLPIRCERSEEHTSELQ